MRPGAGTPPAASDGETERLRRRLALLERELEESRESERRLRESEDRLARFAANVSDVLSSYDLIGQTHAFVSPSFERLTGYPVAELLADPPGLARRMTWPEDLDRVIRAVSTHAATGPEGDPLKIEYRLVRRDGRVIWISETITREFGPNGKAVSANSVIRDISERQRAEDRFQRFASAVTDVIYRFDLTTQKYDFISPSCRRLTGYSVEELMADPYVIVDRAIHPNDRELVLETARAHLKRGPGAGPISVDYRIVAKDGRIVWVSETIDYDFTADGQAASVNSVIHDSTARKQAEAERERLIVELESKNAELERFAYTVSHDLKSPLITITGFLGALEDDLASGDAEQASADIQRIARAARRMQQLLDDLLELSRVGRSRGPHEPVDLGQLTRDVLEALAGAIQARGVEVEVAPDLPRIRGDRTRLHQLLQNLIENAVKFMGDQSRPWIAIESRPDGAGMVVCVRDNGCGIAPRHQREIFELFEKLDPNTPGTGLGLALAKRIVEVHGGRIWVESTGEGNGSTFCFRLPA